MKPSELKQLIKEEIRSVLNENQFELVGSDADELLDAMSILNRDMTDPDRSFRDKLKPLDKTGHKMSNGKFSIKVVKTGDTEENDYLRIANEYLEDRGYKTKLYKIK